MSSVSDDPMPPERLIGEVPSWTFDIYSREGRAALESFIRGSSRTARWLRHHVAPASRVRCLGGILFRVEGGLVKQRSRWPTANRLKDAVDFESHGLRRSDAAELLDLMRDDILVLNRERRNGR
jgi:hypothetical protein